jgi:hypothetical protein
MADETEKEQVREYNAVGAVAGLMFLVLLLLFALVAMLMVPSIDTTVPAPLPGHAEQVSDE